MLELQEWTTTIEEKRMRAINNHQYTPVNGDNRREICVLFWPTEINGTK